MAALTIYAEQDITPTFVDVLKAAKQNVFGDEPLDVDFIGPGDAYEPDAAILELGKSKTFTGAYVRTYSPKQLVSRATAVSDLGLALTHMMSVIDPPVYTYRVIENLSELDSLSRTNPVIADIEVGGDIRTDLPWETWLLSVAFNDGEQILVVPEELCKQATEWVWGPLSPLHQALIDCITVWHNGKFDCRTLNALLGLNIYPSHDTMLMHFAMHHGAKEHGLKPLAQKYFNAPEWEKDIEKYTVGKAHYENIPRPLLYKYNAGDVYWAGRLYQKFRAELENDPPRRTLYARILEIAGVLQDIEVGGVEIDVAYFEKLSADLGAEVEKHHDRLRELTDNADFNPGSPVQVKKFLAEQGHEVKSSDEPTLEVLRRELGEGELVTDFIDSLLEFRGRAKLKSTYADGILRRTRKGILYPQYLAHGTTTGRLSSKDPNVQNMPRGPEVRTGLAVHRPDEDTNAECDYSQAELRTLAELTGDVAMIAAFQPGAVDYFDAMMPNAFPSRFETVEDYLNLKNEPAGSKWHDLAVELRAKLKGVQYGMNYGRGIKAIAIALNITVAEAQALVEGIFATYPGLQVWQENVRAAVTDPSLKHFLTTPFNRVFEQEVITDRNLNAVQNAALAFVPQSTANDLTLTAAVEVHRRSKDYDYRITALIHDAIIGQGPRENAEPWAAMVKREMEGAAAAVFHRVPFNASASFGDNWAVL